MGEILSEFAFAEAIREKVRLSHRAFFLHRAFLQRIEFFFRRAHQ